MSTNQPTAVWPARLRKATKMSRDVFWCPAQPPGFRWQDKKGSGPGFATQADTVWGYEYGEMLLDVMTVPFSYAYNDWGATNCQIPQRGLGSDLKGGFNLGEIKAARVKAPAEMIAIADGTSIGSWNFNLDPTQTDQYPGKIHNNGANVLYCDGHVTWSRQKDLIITPSMSAAQRDMVARRWNLDNKP